MRLNMPLWPLWYGIQKTLDLEELNAMPAWMLVWAIWFEGKVEEYLGIMGKFPTVNSLHYGFLSKLNSIKYDQAY
jgi:hypothetical protein